MKKTALNSTFVLLIAFTFCALNNLHAQNTTTPFSYDEQWSKVELFTKDGRPESALREVDIILKQAERDQNAIQLIKATLRSMVFTLQIDPQKAADQIAVFEALIDKTKNEADKALMQSMTAELYLKYYQYDTHTINQRTEVVGLSTKNIREWTKNLFTEKIHSLLSASLSNANPLQRTDVRTYEALLIAGNSYALEPTLYDFLARRKIELLKTLRILLNISMFTADANLLFAPSQAFIVKEIDHTDVAPIDRAIIETYQQWLQFREKDANTSALIMTDYNRLTDFKKLKENRYFHQLKITVVEKAYVDALHALAAKFSTNETIVTVLAAEASIYKENNVPNDSIQQYYNRKAYDICSDGIKRFPNATYVDLLKNLKEEIAKKQIQTYHNSVAKPHTKINVELITTNIDRVELKIYRVNTTAQIYYKDSKHKSYKNKLYSNTKLIEKRTIDISKDSNFYATYSSVFITTGEYGIYEFSITTPDDETQLACGWFVVSDMATMAQNSSTNSQLYVVDRVSGKPLSNVKLNGYDQDWNEKITSSTDKKGFCDLSHLPKNQQRRLILERGSDKYLSSNNFIFNYSNTPTKSEQVHVAVLTDRSIYRPGQTVYFKGIAYMVDKEVQKVVENNSFEVTLIDANHKQIASKTLKTNEFGSFADSFVLPGNGLNGAFTIKTQNNGTTIWVEEYKRPTFEVSLERPKTEVHFGETVHLKGKALAYAGYAITDALVSYRVVRRTHHRWWWVDSPEIEISNGTTKTLADGLIELTFKPQKDSSITEDQFFTYRAYTTVTDQKGETQIGELAFSVGDKSLFIVSTNQNKRMDKLKEITLDVKVETLNGENVEATLNYELYRMDLEGRYIDAKNNTEQKPKIGAKVLSGNFHTKNGALKLDLKKFDSGQYQIVYSTIDDQGHSVKKTDDLTLYSKDEKSPPVKSYVWLEKIKTMCAVGEKAIIKYGTSANNVHMLHQIMMGGVILKSYWITLSNEIKTFEIPFLSSYGDGVNLVFTFIKDEQLFTTMVQVAQKVEERKLSPKLTVFRNKLQPGEKAEWTVSIPELRNKKETAEMLIDMYDASLDVLRPHQFSFNPRYCPNVPNSPYWSSTISARNGDISQPNIPKHIYNTLTYNQLDWKSFNLFRREFFSGGFSTPIRGISSTKQNIDASEFEGLELTSIDESLQGRIAGLDFNVTTDEVVDQEGDVEKSVKIRSNFNETAFFYPQLRTDEQGHVKFSFTVPESLTSWNLKIVAHTKDLYSGQAENQVVTQKDLMVQLNLPRFVRRSDKMILGANLINLTDSIQTVKVKLELINPENDQPIKLKEDQAKTIVLLAKETKPVSWELTEFAPFDMVVCKVMASSKSFSDGEQRYLPVLPDQVLVTETLPMTVRTNQTKNFTLENLKLHGSKVNTQSLTVEFSPNPAWYAVQALPTLSVSENDNAIDLFTAYYVNTLASFMATSNPNISVVYNQWKQSPQSHNALISNLEKNQELKTMLLDETPWVLAGQNETDQKRQIALLFELNQQKQQNAHYWEKLMKLQRPSGGFTWFEGMPECRHTTQFILLNWARLNTMTKAVSKTENAAMIRAIAYIDLAIAGDFEELKKHRSDYNSKMTIGDVHWFYLHVRSEYPEVPIPEYAQEAVDFYTAQAQEYWQRATLYGKAATALIAGRNKNPELASKILVSLKENALKTEDMGMYWARNTAGMFWNQRPVMVQSMILEAFAEQSKTSAELDEMKIWLLRQKQTQRWDSPLSTVDAIYALLHTGSDWLASSNEVSIQLGDVPVRTDQKEAGTGYIKQRFDAREVTSSMARAKVELKGKSGFGWGAMYWQYYQNASEVKQSGNALTVSKKLFVEQLLPTGKAMTPIEKTELKVGDKVITRLVVTVDRDMEYVALKDLRAACLEPVQQRSGCVWKEGVFYYQTTKDASTQFFFSSLPKGSYVFEYEAWVNNAGTFTSGITTLQCQYAPEFCAHSGGSTMVVSEGK